MTLVSIAWASDYVKGLEGFFSCHSFPDESLAYLISHRILRVDYGLDTDILERRGDDV